MVTDWARLVARAALDVAEANPLDLVRTLGAVLADFAPGVRATVYLADYRLDELVPLDGSVPAQRIEGSEHGRCFASRRVLAPPGRLIAPVVVHGDRWGVLELHGIPPAGTTGAAGEEAVRAAAALGRVLGQGLLAADRVTDAYRRARRGRSLTLSAEMQWDLLPGRSLDVGYASVAGQLEPAYTVAGDLYDWAGDAAGLSVVLVDGGGAGVAASGVASFTVSAVRNARREGLDLAGVARLADQALHARHGGTLLSSAILLRYLPRPGTVEVVTAGAGTVVHVGPGGARYLAVDVDPPLGAEEDYPYRATTFAIGAGERLIMASNGLTDAQLDEVTFGDGLRRLAQGLRLLDPPEVVRALIRELRTFHGGRSPRDDAVVVCLDASRRVPVRPHPVPTTPGAPSS